MKVFLAGLLLIGLHSNAQYNPVGAITMWTEGYVITQQQDTIRGQVRIGSLINDSPETILVRHADNTKTKIKGDDVQLIAQRIPDFAYATGSIPQGREMVIFERVPNPRRKDRPMLLERLTIPGGAIALYFDVAGWKKTTAYTFGSFVLETDHQELSYVAVKNGRDAFVARRSELATVYDRLFGDCPAFGQSYPALTRRDWRGLGELVDAYNHLCR
ncbi:hypothetical protein [Spirosoma koreense]